MTLWIHSMILAASLAATVAIGIASAGIYSGPEEAMAVKADRLPLPAATDTAYVTVETRANGASILSRVPAAE